MKIRTDFVTNSSSVSYILTMCEEMVDIYMRALSIAERDPQKAKIIKTLRDDLKKNGTCVFLEGKEIITKRLKFNDDETLTDDVLQTPVETLDGDELWAYIFGQYILGGRLSGIWGFGVTQIETY